jgi:TPP-dependent pyruvate/acetoin dehydrogenase alpha subunit
MTTSRLERRADLATAEGRLRRMIEIRNTEQAIQGMFNDGHVRGSTHLSNGQEAVSVGIAAAIRSTDKVTCTYRGHGTALALGVSPLEVIGEIAGRVVGCAGGMGGSMHLVGTDVGLFPSFAIIGAGVPVAVGAALTAKTKGTDDLAVAIFGDGSTNIGGFHEGLNMAAIFKLPVIFVIENNLYGEYTRIQLSTPVTDLAERATSYAMPSEIVDGQDVDAVKAAVERAAERARSGGGPTLLEMKTYRYSGHSKSDPATYRPAGELDEWLKRDPIDIAAKKLTDSGTSDAAIATLRDEVKAFVDQSLADALAADTPDLSELLRHVRA